MLQLSWIPQTTPAWHRLQSEICLEWLISWTKPANLYNYTNENKTNVWFCWNFVATPCKVQASIICIIWQNGDDSFVNKSDNWKPLLHGGSARGSHDRRSWMQRRTLERCPAAVPGRRSTGVLWNKDTANDHRLGLSSFLKCCCDYFAWLNLTSGL